MTDQQKPREFWVYSSTRGWQVYKQKQPRVLCEPIHVIEKFAYDKAVSYLDTIAIAPLDLYSMEEKADLANKFKTMCKIALRELGELK